MRAWKKLKSKMNPSAQKRIDCKVRWALFVFRVKDLVVWVKDYAKWIMVQLKKEEW